MFALLYIYIFFRVVAVIAAVVVLGFVEGSEPLYTGDLVSYATFYSLTERVRM